MRAHLAPVIDRTGQLELLRRLDRAVVRDPRHDFRKGEVLGPAAHFPDAFVGSIPDRVEVLQHRALDRPCGFVGLQAADAREVQRVHHFAIDVDLQLVDRAVADAHRRRALVARQPRDFPLGQAALAAMPYMIWICEGEPAITRPSHARHARASS